MNGIIFTDISDHLPIVHVCNMNNYKETPKLPQNNVNYKRTFNDKNIKSFINAMKNTSRTKILTNSNNPDDAFNEFSKLFMMAFETNFPQKIIKKHIDKEKSPWMTNCILKSVKRKNKLYKTFLKNPSRKNEKTYKRYKNKLNHIIQLSKRLYYEEQLIRYKNNSKMIWKTLNNVLNRKQKTKELPREFIMEDSSKKIIDPNEIANTFNEYFINIGPKVASKIKNTTNATFNNYMENKNTMFFDPITETELENEIRNMNPNKCPGYDGISIKTIILCAK